MKDGDGRWLEVNPAGLELFQLEKVDYRGKTEEELVAYSPFYKEALLYCRRTDAEAWKKGDLSRNEERIPRPDGTIRTFDVLKIPLFYQDGTRKGLLILGRDITERKLAEEERDRLLEKEQSARGTAERAEKQASFLAQTSQLLAESLDFKDTSNRLVHACVPFVGDWSILWARGNDRNACLTAIANQNPLPEIIERQLQKLCFNPQTSGGLATAILQGKPLLLTNLNTASDAERLASIGSTNPKDLPILEALGLDSFIAVPLLVHGRHFGALTLGRTAATARFTPDDLSLIENLARHGSLVLANARLYEEARNAIVARDDFLSIASHELRTPCTSLRLGIEALLRHARQDSFAHSSPAFLERMLVTSDRQSKHLLYLIDRLL
ncbi:MAG TPA: PAS domain-containing protein, partial [Polyangium sp.]|nr:PAS domain-containing protein [Polyangium sp.]